MPQKEWELARTVEEEKGFVFNINKVARGLTLSDPYQFHKKLDFLPSLKYYSDYE